MGPFAYEGVITMNPPEAEAIQKGSALVASELDPLAKGSVAGTAGH